MPGVFLDLGGVLRSDREALAVVISREVCVVAVVKSEEHTCRACGYLVCVEVKLNNGVSHIGKAAGYGAGKVQIGFACGIGLKEDKMLIILYVRYAVNARKRGCRSGSKAPSRSVFGYIAVIVNTAALGVGNIGINSVLLAHLLGVGFIKVDNRHIVDIDNRSLFYIFLHIDAESGIEGTHCSKAYVGSIHAVNVNLCDLGILVDIVNFKADICPLAALDICGIGSAQRPGLAVRVLNESYVIRVVKTEGSVVV